MRVGKIWLGLRENEGREFGKRQLGLGSIMGSSVETAQWKLPKIYEGDPREDSQ